MADTISINRIDLLGLVKSNRATHREKYEEAVEGWRRIVLRELNEFVDDMKAGKTPKMFISRRFPVDHTGDYDAVTDWLQFSSSETVELSLGTFRTYARDEWEWKSTFGSTYAEYTGKEL